MLDLDADINATGGIDGTPLIAAIRIGDTQIMGILIEAGADVNIVAGERGTALQTAVKHGHLDAVAALLAAGADVNITGGSDGTPLIVASLNGDAQIVGILIEAGADVNIVAGEYGTALTSALTVHCQAVITKLMIAARMSIVCALLAAGAHIDCVPCGTYLTVLHAAIHIFDGQSSMIVTEFLKYGADISVLAYKQPPLDTARIWSLGASEFCRPENQDRLVTIRKIDSEIKKKVMQTHPTMHDGASEWPELLDAIFCERADLVRRLVHRRGSSRIALLPSGELRWPLMDAIQTGAEDVVRVLVEAGAEVDDTLLTSEAREYYGARTPVEMALKTGDAALIRAVLYRPLYIRQTSLTCEATEQHHVIAQAM